MTTSKQISSNRHNALVSTGPKSEAGKSRSAKNALTHGLRSTAPIVPGESPAAWAKHRRGIVESLTPANPLESELAERAAILLWRLHRVTTHECLTVGGAVAETLDTMRRSEADLAREQSIVVERREALPYWKATLAKLDELPALTDAASIPEDLAGTIIEFVLNGALDWLPGGQPTWEDIEAMLDGEKDNTDDDPVPTEEEVAEAVGAPAGDWTAHQLRRAVEFVAGKVGATVDELLAATRRELSGHIASQRGWIADTEAKLPHKAREAETQSAVRVGRSLLPENVELLTRYESHLSRQLNQVLQTLEALRSARNGGQSPAPQ